MPMERMNALPQVIQDAVRGQAYTRNTTGLSGAGVLMFDDMVLKIAPDDQTSRRRSGLLRQA